MDSLAKHRKRLRLYREQSGRCHWCEQSMLLGRRYNPRYGEESLPKLATFEHLDSKLSLDRGMRPGERRVVLACYRCNHNRGRKDVEQPKKNPASVSRRSELCVQEDKASMGGERARCQLVVSRIAARPT